jgi:hypothetical protein
MFLFVRCFLLFAGLVISGSRSRYPNPLLLLLAFHLGWGQAQLDESVRTFCIEMSCILEAFVDSNVLYKMIRNK